MNSPSKTNKCLALLKQLELESKDLLKDKRTLEAQLRANPNMEYSVGQNYMIERRERQIFALREFGMRLADALGCK